MASPVMMRSCRIREHGELHISERARAGCASNPADIVPWPVMNGGL
jgi:hypothetical protein